MNPVRPSASGALDSPQPQLQLVRWRSHARQVRPARQVRQVRHAPPPLMFCRPSRPAPYFSRITRITRPITPYFSHITRITRREEVFSLPNLFFLRVIRVICEK